MTNVLPKLVIFALLVGVAASVRFEILVDFDSTTLDELYAAGQGLLIARKAPIGAWHTVWAAFQPFPHNFIDWDDRDSYGVYVSPGQLEDGRVLFPGSFANVSLGLLYPFRLGSFDSPRSANWVGNNQVGILNNGSTEYIFGLTTNLVVNGR